MISVIIPCFNCEAFVGRAIKSVLQQTYSNYEIILVDNNSTDKTGQILAEFSNQYPDKIRVFMEKKKGAPAARNKGLSEAKGEWIQFLDADDELLPNKLKNQIELTKDKNVDLVVGNCYKWREGEDESKKWIVRADTGNPWKALLKSRLGNTCNNLWRKALILSIGGWNERMTSSQEYELMFRLLKHGIAIRYHEVPETIVYVRRNSIARNENNDKLIEILENRINLRLAIYQHLHLKGELTRELKYTFSKAVHSKLLPHMKRVPDYVTAKLDQLQAMFPFEYIVKMKVEKMESQTKKFIKKIFS
jgi:glycosyltransferase involved in cell wall biosynthesis